MGSIKAVAELKAVLLETEYLELLAMEISVKLVAMTSKTALVQLAPNGSHGVNESDAEDDDGLGRQSV